MTNCAQCGLQMTKAEGGTIFTVCSSCWEREQVVQSFKDRIVELMAESAAQQLQFQELEKEVITLRSGSTGLYWHEKFQDLKQKTATLNCADNQCCMGANPACAAGCLVEGEGQKVRHALSQATMLLNRWLQISNITGTTELVARDTTDFLKWLED